MFQNIIFSCSAYSPRRHLDAHLTAHSTFISSSLISVHKLLRVMEWSRNFYVRIAKTVRWAFVPPLISRVWPGYATSSFWTRTCWHRWFACNEPTCLKALHSARVDFRVWPGMQPLVFELVRRHRWFSITYELTHLLLVIYVNLWVDCFAIYRLLIVLAVFFKHTTRGIFFWKMTGGAIAPPAPPQATALDK